MAPDSVAAAIYAVWRETTAGLVLDHPSLRAVAASPAPLEGVQPMTMASRIRTTILAWIEKDDTSFLPPGETWPGLLAKSLAQATEWLTANLGANMDEWRWDRIHRTAPKHPLSVTFPQHAGLLDPPAVGVGGDGDTPQCGSFGGSGGSGFTITGMSVNRYCFDPFDWDRSGWVVPLGACGHPGSPHFADQRIPWSEQRLLPMRYSWDAVMADAAEQQRLEPA
jgi:penicillin amidase